MKLIALRTDGWRYPEGYTEEYINRRQINEIDYEYDEKIHRDPDGNVVSEEDIPRIPLLFIEMKGDNGNDYEWAKVSPLGGTVEDLEEIFNGAIAAFKKQREANDRL